MRPVVPGSRRSGLVLAAAGASLLAVPARAGEASRAALDALIERHARAHELPPALVHRVVRRESNYDPRAVSRGNYGLMQIRHGTARGLGYTGGADGLLDPGTNLRYAVAYLAGAYRVADGNHDRTVALYSRGYHHDARRRGLVGRLPAASEPPEPTPAPAAPPPEKPSWLAALFGPGAPSGSEARALPMSSPSPAEGEPEALEAPAEPPGAAPGPEARSKTRRKAARPAPRGRPADPGPRLADQEATPGRS